MPTELQSSAAGLSHQTWLDGETVRLCGTPCGAELAGRLLAARDVRSVSLDHLRGEATVHLRSDHNRTPASDTLLAEIASLAGEQQTAMSAATQRLEAAEEILCWLDRDRGVDSYFRAPHQVAGLWRLPYLIGAAVTFVFAVIGLILPGLPATPFLLLTSSCLLRSSRPLHDRLLRSRIFGGLLREWRAQRGVRPGVKTKSVMLVTLVATALVWSGGLPTMGVAAVVSAAAVAGVAICRLRVVG